MLNSKKINLPKPQKESASHHWKLGKINPLYTEGARKISLPSRFTGFNSDKKWIQLSCASRFWTICTARVWKKSALKNLSFRTQLFKHLKFDCEIQCFTIWPRHKTLLVKHFCFRQAEIVWSFLKILLGNSAHQAMYSMLPNGQAFFVKQISNVWPTMLDRLTKTLDLGRKLLIYVISCFKPPTVLADNYACFI